MLHKFWKKLSLSFFIFFLVCSYGKGQTKNDKEQPQIGIFLFLEKLIEVDRAMFNNLVEQIQSSPIISSRLHEFEEVHLAPVFVESLLFHSNQNYLSLAQNDYCKINHLIELDLLSQPYMKLEGIPIYYKVKEGGFFYGLADRKQYFNYIKEKKCKKNKEISDNFSPDKQKSLIENLILQKPIDEVSCVTSLNFWKNFSLLPNLCKMVKVIQESPQNQLVLTQADNENQKKHLRNSIREASRYKKLMSPEKQIYFNHLCNNLSTPVKYCEKFIINSYWQSLADKAINSSEIISKCKDFYGKEDIKRADIRFCADVFTQKPELCHFMGSDKTGLKPAANCLSQSKAFFKTKVKNIFRDCPGEIDNHAIVTFNRIWEHFGLSTNKKSLSCDSRPLKNMFDLIEKEKTKNAWSQKLCFKNPFNENKEECLPILLANSTYGDHSEEIVVSKVLKKIRAVSDKVECKTASDKEYNPTRLKWRMGCYLVYDTSNCSKSYCPKTIYYKNSPLKNVWYSGGLFFDYFPNSLKDDLKSLVYTMNRNREDKDKPIKNVTELRHYLSVSPQSIVHGVGCIEDLYPGTFQKIAVNECRPVSFIIDGLIDKDLKSYVTIRTGIDDTFSPKIISWTKVFNAIENYQNHQPINHWTLYGIR